MERLTKRIPNTEGKNVVVYTMGEYKDTTAGEMTGNDIRNVLRALANYEDLEEQGLLLKLPCKIGDTVYYIDDGEICELVVYSYDIRPLQRFALSRYGTRLNFKQFGKTAFLTREEAEEVLKKEGGENEQID